MVMGMGAVFVFLTLLVFATGFMSKVVGRYSPVTPPAAPTPSASTPKSPSEDQQLMAVITAAIHKHRSRQK